MLSSQGCVTRGGFGDLRYGVQTPANASWCPAAFTQPRSCPDSPLWCHGTGDRFTAVDCDSDGLLDAACVAANGTRHTRRSTDLCVQRINASAAECPAAFGSSKLSLEAPALPPASDAGGGVGGPAGEADTATARQQDQSAASGSAPGAGAGDDDQAAAGSSAAGASTALIVGCAVGGLVAAVAAAVVGVWAWRRARGTSARVVPSAAASGEKLQQA
ncbi:hypothetical protein HYH03_012739 [Edaphochlamys debaryana]|nr:hypothetical protein HYH03_012739 [Edaphochlamys debaryana]|eukprot:KAG2488740.1 hypothetical protein HYH03_012739 [Edaphochlamys debaryana]